MEHKKKIRLSDIAAQLNISTVTVSKALTNKDGVSEELRRKIKHLADEMGYKIKIARQDDITNNLTGNIGILIPSRFFSNNFSFYWYLFNHLSTELLKKNFFTIMELLSDEDEKNLVQPRMLQDQKIDGLIILGQTSTDYLNSIHSIYDEFILLDFYTSDVHFDSVSNDNYYSSYLLTKYVISQGHKDIRFVGNFNATSSIQDRYMGFAKAMIESGLECKTNDIINDRDNSGKSIPLELPVGNMPTAFICNNDVTANLLTKTLLNKGFKVPEDISVTGFDNYIPGENPVVPLTTVYIRPEDIARSASDLLLAKIFHQNYQKGRHLVNGNIIIRDSVKAI